MNKKDTRFFRLVFDQKSHRWKDSQGFLHVDACHITKAGVRPYMGSELPKAQELGLDPTRIYNVLCPVEELEKAAKTFEGLHLLFRHVEDSATDPQKELRIGNVGTSAVMIGGIVTGKQIGRASCRERVSSPV